jgi:hypothetical protein
MLREEKLRVPLKSVYFLSSMCFPFSMNSCAHPKSIRFIKPEEDGFAPMQIFYGFRSQWINPDS